MVSTLLYPIDSPTRQAVSLNGMWGFRMGEKAARARRHPRSRQLRGFLYGEIHPGVLRRLLV